MAIEVAPQEDGTWTVGDESFETRKEAIEAAHDQRGDKRVKTVDAETDEVLSEGFERGGDDAIVLLRTDGSVYGELSEPAGTPEQRENAQKVDLFPAGESSEAGTF